MTMKYKAPLMLASLLLASCSDNQDKQVTHAPEQVVVYSYEMQSPETADPSMPEPKVPMETRRKLPPHPKYMAIPSCSAAPPKAMMSKKAYGGMAASSMPGAPVSFGASTSFGSGWGSGSGSSGQHPTSTERYDSPADNTWLTPDKQALSTFSIDVDTASYSNLRRMIQDNSRIPRNAVRLEEMVNYFDYHYPQPTGAHPFAVHVHNATSPWNPERQLVRVALKGKEVPRLERPAANLIFLLDVSGSMNSSRKLPLVVESMRILVDQLNGDDSLAIVVYAGSEGLALPATACNAAGRDKISGVLSNLRPGGSTNGEAGMHLAYKLARENFKEGGINRVVLATDGDFNVGMTGNQSLVELVAENAKSQIDLTVIGVGTGNLNDSMLESITNHGDGAYHYVDSIQEGRRVFLDKLMGTLVTIAKDVKIQVEFNPAQVKQYRLLGYANRMLRKEDFANDRVDAGDIGSGHTVTAFYEVETVHRESRPEPDKLRYSEEHPKADPKGAQNPEWLHVKLRYKTPGATESVLVEHPYIGVQRSLQEADMDFQFAASVAMAAMWMRGGEAVKAWDPRHIVERAEAALGQDADGKRREFVNLMNRAKQRGPGLRYRR